PENEKASPPDEPLPRVLPQVGVPEGEVPSRPPPADPDGNEPGGDDDRVSGAGPGSEKHASPVSVVVVCLPGDGLGALCRGAGAAADQLSHTAIATGASLPAKPGAPDRSATGAS